jgi:hypothetical protein
MRGWVGLAALVFIVLIAFLVVFGIDPRVSGQGAELKDFFNDVVAFCVVVMFHVGAQAARFRCDS